MRDTVGLWTNQVAVTVAQVTVVANVPRRIGKPPVSTVAVFLIPCPSTFLGPTPWQTRTGIAVAVIVESAPPPAGSAIKVAAAASSASWAAAGKCAAAKGCGRAKLGIR